MVADRLTTVLAPLGAGKGGILNLSRLKSEMHAAAPRHCERHCAPLWFAAEWLEFPGGVAVEARLPSRTSGTAASPGNGLAGG